MFLSWLVADIKMIVRNRQALFWALAFPLIFVAVFGLFDLDRPTKVTIAVVDHAQDPLSRQLVESLRGTELVEVDSSLPEAEARAKLQEGDLGFLLLIPSGLMAQAQQGAAVPISLLYNQARPEVSYRFAGVIRQFVDQANLAISNTRPVLALRLEGVVAKDIRYFDALLPGLVGMGVMTFAIIGMASVLASYRENRIFKRLLTTPLKVPVFFASQITARLLLSLVQAAIIFGAGMLFFHAHIYGNLLWALLLVVAANIIFLNLGFVVGSFARNVEAASSLGNLVALPMMFFSGVFFPTESLPPVLARVVEFLPLTPLLDAMRGVLLESKSLWLFGEELAILAAWVVISSALAIRFFRFG